MKTYLLVVLCLLGVGGFAFVLHSCELHQEAMQAKYDKEREEYVKNEWEGNCHDEAMLLATTVGSPDEFKCPNKLHHMRFEVQPKAKSGEEIGVLVVCECEHK